MSAFQVMPLITPGVRRRDRGEVTGVVAGATRPITAGQIGREAPRTSWPTFLTRVFRWDTREEGEHIGMIGPTGQGKTTLLVSLLPLKPYVCVAATKPRDKSMDYLINHRGYIKLERWHSLDPAKHPRRVIWPDASQIDAQDRQKIIFGDMLARVYREGNWVCAIDELWYFDQVLGLRKPVEIMELQSRSLGISLIASTQRPAWVPRVLYTSSTHLFFWRTNDEDDLRSLGGVGFISAKLIREVVAHLDKYEFLYINTRTGSMCRSKVARKG